MIEEPSDSCLSNDDAPSTLIGFDLSAAIIFTELPTLLMVAAIGAIAGSLMRVMFALGDEPRVI